jgi:uncharacterized protein GlcG (DUF336 family)
MQKVYAIVSSLPSLPSLFSLSIGLIVGLVLSVSGALVSAQAQEAATGEAQAAPQELEQAPATNQEAVEPVESADNSHAGSLAIVTLDMAESIIAGAKAKAEEAGWAMSFAVVDNFGRPVAMARMDGTRWMTPKIAHSKAFTSATFGRASASVGEFAESRKQLFKSAQEVIGEPLLPAGGGLPILVDGKLLGGVGASGGTEAEDIEAARAGLDAIGAE